MKTGAFNLHPQDTQRAECAFLASLKWLREHERVYRVFCQIVDSRPVAFTALVHSSVACFDLTFQLILFLPHIVLLRACTFLHIPGSGYP